MSAAVSEDVKPILGFDTRVKAIQQLGPSMKRFTLAGESLKNFGSDENGDTLDLRIKVMIPNRGTELPDLVSLIADSDLTWYQTWLGMDADSRGIMRTYTVRERRVEAGELDIDFVVHLDERGGSGPACDWAINAQVGDPLTLIGPNRERGTCQGIEFKPGEAKNLLLVGDETAVPAISAILENLDESYTGQVFLEVPLADDFRDLRRPSGVTVNWLARGDAGHGAKIAEAVRKACAPTTGTRSEDPEDVNVDEVILWETGFDENYQRDSQFYAWVAGEAAAVKEIRRYLVRDVGIDRASIAFMGYWRQGKSER